IAVPFGTMQKNDPARPIRARAGPFILIPGLPDQDVYAQCDQQGANQRDEILRTVAFEDRQGGTAMERSLAFFLKIDVLAVIFRHGHSLRLNGFLDEQQDHDQGQDSL
ncbi:MAG: hypothetical protein OEZ03_02120, partial [Alphaproteobacteria bacterium]|nr:hypothetical protein [Alphaproteobacteria bacterium]